MTMEKNKVRRSLGVMLIVLILGFAAVILLQLSSIFLGPSKRACTKKVCLSKFLEGPPAFNDIGLKNYIVGKFFTESSGPAKYSEGVGFDRDLEEVQSFIMDYFKNKKGGKFAVLGAGDGEYQDITIPLEKELGWSGFMVEPQPTLFEKLKNKGRKATLSNNCVSPFAYPAIVNLGHTKPAVGDSDEAKYKKFRGTKVKQLFEDDTNIEGFKVQCVPLENLLYAAGLEKHIDLLVLDMSGTDLDVLINVKLDMLPDIEMVVVRSNGNNIGSDLGGYFLDKNLVLKKAVGQKPEDAIYILVKFRNEDEDL